MVKDDSDERLMLSAQLSDEEIIQRLVARKWSVETARLALRARFRCEYCGRDLLRTLDNYKLLQVDHIVPLSRRGSPDDFDNLALACRLCNWDLKRAFDVRTVVGPSASRAEMIRAIARYCDQRRSEMSRELEVLRTLRDEHFIDRPQVAHE